MEKIKKILIIAPYAFGYTAEIEKTLERLSNHKIETIYLDQPKFAYKNTLHRVKNFFFKLAGKNLKKSFVLDRIKKEVKEKGKQDFTFIIRPDVLDDKTLSFIKQYTKKFVAYYYDSTRRFPRKLEIIRFFDKVYSYDTEDVKKYNFNLLTNYIYDESNYKNIQDIFFNISTYDHRFDVIESCASYLNKKKWSYNIKVYNPTPIEHKYVTHITQQIQVKEVIDQLKKSKIIIEIQRNDQTGLSFRVFEALGHRKKLITTNKDIVNYDFYNPNNILVIDENNIYIPEEFVNTDYQEVDNEILDKYRLENWVKNVFELQ